MRTVASEELQALKRKLQSLSYGIKGQDPRKLFGHYDRDNSGLLDFAEFQSAVRKGGHMTPAMLSSLWTTQRSFSPRRTTLLRLKLWACGWAPVG